MLWLVLTLCDVQLRSFHKPATAWKMVFTIMMCWISFLKKKMEESRYYLDFSLCILLPDQNKAAPAASYSQNRLLKECRIELNDRTVICKLQLYT